MNQSQEKTLEQTKSTLVALARGKQRIEMAESRKTGIGPARDGMKNLLFNHCEELVQALKDNIRLREENEMLEKSLADADQEIDELTARIKTFEEQNARKRTRKTPGAKTPLAGESETNAFSVKNGA